MSYVLRFVARVKITRIEVRSTDESFEYNLLFSSASGELVKFIIDEKEKVGFVVSPMHSILKILGRINLPM